MNKLTLSRRASALPASMAAVAAFLSVTGGCASAAETAPSSVEALVYSTMPSTFAHAPQMSMDGDNGSYFKSVYGMDDGDTFLILLSQPVPVKSLKITSGDTDGNDTITRGIVEVSPDATTYARAASFNNAGVAEATLPNTPVLAVRVRLNNRTSLPKLVIREIALDTPSKVTTVTVGPGRGFTDISQAPECAEWAAKAEKQMESFWADTQAILYSDKFITPNMVNVVYRTGPDVTPVAATGGGVMTVNSAWCKAHPEDTGLTVHEMAHVIQAMSAYDPVWLIEGVADYIRWIRYEPENYRPGLNPATATYHDSYRTTGLFLAWCEVHYDKTLVTKLNDDVRFGNFNLNLFKKYTGKDVDTLWAEFITAYKADSTTNLFAKPVPPAEKPRTLPTVTTSKPVDVSKVFTDTGIFADGTAFGANTGFDGGGAGFSSALLGTTQTVKGVQFTIGKPGGNNIISASGQTIPVEAGNYSSLWLLGAAVEGNQKNQTLTVTYTDGSTEELAQNFSDWFQPQGFPGESRGVKMDYRIMGDGSKDTRTFYAYSYGFKLNAAKTVKSITLPNNPKVKILSISLGR